MSTIHRIAGVATFLVLLALATVPGVARADAAQLLHAAYEKMLGSKFVTTAVTTDAKGRQTTATTEFETIERLRIDAGGTGFIVLPEGIWMRSGSDAPWTKPPFDVGGMLKQLVPRTVSDLRAQAKNVRDEGERTIDGRSLRAIGYDVDTTIMGIAMSSSNTTFIDAQGRIVRTESAGTAMGMKSTTVQEVRYDDSIRVTAPGS